ncbi:OOP family OmpA-OmpF porin [Kineococcus xinjiangensis]|uniref:OOP family OmpA-OmpF porin n=1 Tax=Kineococcus xinjiangensis TaxID=512762 RepID=A0A2S6ICP6_9ACTN|nr:OOP family OmpA-OmpF porin [Kineococcus xinjiangensis]
MVSRGRSLATLLALACLATACTGSEQVRPGSAAPTDATGAAQPSTAPEQAPEETGTSLTAEELRARLTPPALPSFAVPTDVLRDAENQRIGEQLQVLPGLYRDIAVLDAHCGPSGEAVAADAGGASPVRPDGTGTLRSGDVQVTVAGDGTGVYDAPDLHIAVLPGGAGVYEDVDVRLSVHPDGAGTYESEDLRAFVRADGSGSFEDDTVRAWIDVDGSGSYRGPEGRVKVAADGSTKGDADPAFAAVVAEVFQEGMPPFPPVPRIDRFEPVGEVCGTVVRLDAGVLFDLDSAGVRPEAEALLQRVAGLLGELGTPSVDVVGHTDSTGDEGYNQSLSERRATAVAERLSAQGVPRDSLRPSGRGEREPVRPDTTAAGELDAAAQQLNRRVELVLRHGR